ncbi:MAG: hypothetical protein KDA96_00920, partial [Planctomycetaceae bacterium]|nr:hypothetical protein [Planctomycetaceae bacterium]
MNSIPSRVAFLLATILLIAGPVRPVRGWLDEVKSEPPPPGEPPSAENLQWFEQHIRPLLISRCYSCHSDEQSKHDGNLVLDSKRGWESGGD